MADKINAEHDTENSAGPQLDPATSMGTAVETEADTSTAEIRSPKKNNKQTEVNGRVGKFDYSKLPPAERSTMQGFANAINRHGRRMTESIFAMGKALCEAKNALKHGKWEDWVKSECGVGKKTVERIMKIYTTLDPISDQLRDFPLSVLIELCNLPEPVRATIIQDVEDGAPRPTAKQVRAFSDTSQKSDSKAVDVEHVAVDPAGVEYPSSTSHVTEPTELGVVQMQDAEDADGASDNEAIYLAKGAATLIFRDLSVGSAKVLAGMVENLSPEVLGLALLETASEWKKADLARGRNDPA